MQININEKNKREIKFILLQFCNAYYSSSISIDDHGLKKFYKKNCENLILLYLGTTHGNKVIVVTTLKQQFVVKIYK